MNTYRKYEFSPTTWKQHKPFLWWEREKNVGRLPPGAYHVGSGPGYHYAAPNPMPVDSNLVELDDVSMLVLREFDKVLSQRAAYARHGFPFKRGFFLYGPPGAGKSTAIRALARKVIGLKGVVILANRDMIHSIDAMMEIRNPGEDYPILVIAEDIEGIVGRSSAAEKEVLAFLDGERKLDNVFIISTSNYPELTDKRLFNRPSRFDTILRVGYPDETFRINFLNHYLKDKDRAERLSRKTEGYSIAHLKELCICVLCLGISEEDALDKLQRMIDELPSSEEDARKVGFSYPNHDEED